MTIDINKNSALIDSAASGYSGCGCGNRRYYTKAEIDEMLKDVLSPDEIKEILDEMFEDYIESGDLYELILNIIGDVYSREQIDEMLSNYATRGWVREYTEENYLRDITLTINGTELHNNGSIIIEGGGGEPVDISGKLDVSAFTQAMENETARTESTYAKKSEIPSLAGYATKAWVQSQGYLTQHQDISGKVDKTDFNSFTATTNQCCDYVKGEIDDLWNAITSITGDTPTPTPPASGSSVYITYNVTSTTEPTKIMNTTEVNSNKSRVFLSDGYEIIKSTGYTFEELGLNSLKYVFNSEYIPTQSAGSTSAWYNIDSIVDINIYDSVRNFWGANTIDYCDNLTGITLNENISIYRFTGPSECPNLEYLNIPTNVSITKIGGFRNCPSLYDVVLPEGLKYIEYDFLNGSGIYSITIPSTVVRIEHSCFYNCENLRSITIKATVPPTLVDETNSLGETSKTFPIYVPAESVAEYKRNSYYQHYAHRIEAIPNE